LRFVNCVLNEYDDDDEITEKESLCYFVSKK